MALSTYHLFERSLGNEILALFALNQTFEALGDNDLDLGDL